MQSTGEHRGEVHTRMQSLPPDLASSAISRFDLPHMHAYPPGAQVTRAEFREQLTSLGLSASAAEIDSYFSEIDKNADGYLDQARAYK